MDKDLSMMALVLSFWIVAAWLVFTFIRKHKSAKLRADARDKLLDKLGSSPELLAYLQTEAGKSFLDSGPIEETSPQSRIVTALEIGMVLLFVGAALLLLHWLSAVSGPSFLIFGTLTLALGVGFAFAAGVSYYASKSLGLLEGKPGRRE